MSEIRITGFSLVTNPASVARGLIGFFDCQVGPFLLVGCSLLTTRKGLQVNPPHVGGSGRRSHIAITDEGVRGAITARARAAFVALGGILPAEKLAV